MRLFTILRVFSKYDLSRFLPSVWQTKVFRALFFWQAKESVPQAEGLRLFLQELGPVYIKLGQLMSVRQDLIPADVAEELAQLQDAVPAMDWDTAQAQIETGLSQPVSQAYQSIEAEAMAAASIAQVHRAVKHTGEACVVKVLRPNLEVTINQDLKLARRLSKMLEATFSDAKRLRLPEVIDDYDSVIHDELDLSKEGASLSQVKRNFAGSTLLYVPEVDWELSCDTVLTMEEVTGTPVGDIAALHGQGVNMKLLAERGVEIFFTQVLEHNFFHADMHPGNIFIDSSNPQDPKYVAVDFGIMGALDEDDQYYLAESLSAFFNNDYAQLAKSYIRSGWVDADTSAVALEAAFRTVLEPYMGKPIAEISLAKILMKLFKVSGRFGMSIQPQLVLLDKTLFYIEGLGRQLYPELDLWNTAKPFIESWLKRRLGVSGLLKKSREHFPEWLGNLPETPVQLHRVLAKAAEGKLEVQYKDLAQEKNAYAHQNAQRHLRRTVLSGASIIAAALLWGQSELWLAAAAALAAVLLYIKS